MARRRRDFAKAPDGVRQRRGDQERGGGWPGRLDRSKPLPGRGPRLQLKHDRQAAQSKRSARGWIGEATGQAEYRSDEARCGSNSHLAQARLEPLGAPPLQRTKGLRDGSSAVPKSKNPHSTVQVKDLQNGDITRCIIGRSTRWHLKLRRAASASRWAGAGRTTPSTVADGMSGRIYKTRGGPDNLRWFWSITISRTVR